MDFRETLRVALKAIRRNSHTGRSWKSARCSGQATMIPPTNSEIRHATSVT